MHFIRSLRLAMIALIPVAAISLGLATPGPNRRGCSASGGEHASNPRTCRDPRPGAFGSRPRPPAVGGSAGNRGNPGNAAGRRAGTDRRSLSARITLAPKTVVVLKGTANWDSAFDALIDSFKSLSALSTSRHQTIRQSDDRSTPPPTTLASPTLRSCRSIRIRRILTKDMSMGKSPEGKALKLSIAAPTTIWTIL